MEYGFDFEMYGTIFKNCFIETSSYKNGNLQLSLYGLDPVIGQISHFADITKEPYSIKLKSNEIIVNNHFEPTLIAQLNELGIFKEHTRNCILDDVFYPIYTVNFTKIKENGYYFQELVVA